MWMASTLKTIPGIGTIAGIATVASIAGSLTATLGIAFKALAKSGKKVTKENFKIEINKSKEEAKKLAAQFKEKAKKTNELKTTINFHAKPESFSNKIEFIFNAGGFKTESIRVTKLNGGDPVWQTSSVTSPVVWKPEKLEEGVYIAYLDITDLVPIPIKITKA
jgi:GH24 family phage-related lysozyme (muramidase)